MTAEAQATGTVDARNGKSPSESAGDRPPAPAAVETVYATASQWQLMRRKFRRHRLARISLAVLVSFYVVALLAPFLSPNDPLQADRNLTGAPPMAIRFVEDGSLQWPFVYGYKRTFDLATMRPGYAVDTSRKHPIALFVKGHRYELLGWIAADIHLFGVEGGKVYLLGGDRLGRDMLSRILHGTQISLTLGLVGVFLSFFIGLFMGGISGLLGGVVDLAVQRVIEVLRCFPTIPLWMALAAALPQSWSQVQVFFGITLILSLIGWTDLARVVRGKFLSLRNEDYVTAARQAGAGPGWIIRRHLLPAFASHIIASLTLSIPAMILAETALSFLGLGLQQPLVSWGVLLQEAQNVRSVATMPWVLSPVFFVVTAVLAFNFVGDGLRDAADPYS
jgi:peptide/nickel transport system permease protein